MAKETWKIDAGHSEVGFVVRHLVISKVRGRFGRFSGEVLLPEDDFAQAKVRAHIDAASIDTNDAKRDEHLRSADFLDVAAHPELVFESRRIESSGPDRYRVVGDLGIRAATREVVLDVEVTGRVRDPWGAERVAATAHTSIDRRDFGLAWNVALEAGGVLVGEKVEIEIAVEVVRQAAALAA
jgi:polyisoprenoid-binding protein YceI